MRERGRERRSAWSEQGKEGEGALNGKPAVLLQALAINGVAYSQAKALYIMVCKELPYFLFFERNGRPL